MIDRLIDRTMNACRVFSTTQATRVGLKPNTTIFRLRLSSSPNRNRKIPGRTLQSHIETEIDISGVSKCASVNAHAVARAAERPIKDRGVKLEHLGDLSG
jgi:hypothetical protein